jgi:hypothetical protein
MDQFISRLNGMMMQELEKLDSDIKRYGDLTKKSSDELSNNIKNKTTILNQLRQQYSDLSFKKEQDTYKIPRMEKEYNEILKNIEIQKEENKKLNDEIKKWDDDIGKYKIELTSLKKDYDIMCDKIKELKDKNEMIKITKSIDDMKKSLNEKKIELNETSKNMYKTMMTQINSYSIQPMFDEITAHFDAYKNDMIKEVTKKFSIKLNSEDDLMTIYGRINDNYVKCDIDKESIKKYSARLIEENRYRNFIQTNGRTNIYNPFQGLNIFLLNTQQINKFHIDLTNSYINTQYNDKKKISEYIIQQHSLHTEPNTHFTYLKSNKTEIDNLIAQANDELQILYNTFIKDNISDILFFQEINLDTLEMFFEHNDYSYCRNFHFTKGTCYTNPKKYNDYIIQSIFNYDYNPQLIHNITNVFNYQVRHPEIKDISEKYEKHNPSVKNIFKGLDIYIANLTKYADDINKIRNKYYGYIYTSEYNRSIIHELHYLSIERKHSHANIHIDNSIILSDYIASHFDLFIKKECVDIVRSIYPDVSRENIKMYCEKILFDALGKKYDDIFDLVYYVNNLLF